MVKTKTALIASALSALAIGVLHFVLHSYVFTNPALAMSNMTFIGLIITIAVFLIGFIGMKWRDWF